MRNSKTLQVNINGVDVMGIVRHNHEETVVEITSPFAGFRTSSSLPQRCYRIPNSKSIVERKPAHPDPVKMLAMLYRLCVVLDENRELVVESYEEIEEKIASLLADGCVSDGMFESLRRAFRLLYVDGDMTEQEFHNAVGRLRINHSRFHHKRAQILDRWFTAMFPDPIEDEELREQIVRYIKREEKIENGPSGTITVRRR